MDFLGVGPLELIFILLLALIIFGPNDIVKAGKTLGRFMRKVITSDGWKAFQQTRKGMSNIPTMLMREAGLEEEELRKLSGLEDIENATKDIQNSTRTIGNQMSTWITPPKVSNHPEPLVEEQSIHESSQAEVKIETPGLEPDQEMAAKPEESSDPPAESPFSQTIDDNNK
jgi:Sec-independent protein translocase protein TatA